MKRFLLCVLCCLPMVGWAQRSTPCYSTTVVEIHPPTMNFSWGSYDPGLKPLSYYRDDCSGRVHLAGGISGGYGAVFQLPPGYRPIATEIFGVFGIDPPRLFVAIEPGGWVHVLHAETEKKRISYVSLSGISFVAAQ